jgi:DNA-binding NarL/FixJ family response regulator
MPTSKLISPSELRVLQKLADGLTSKGIAKALGLSYKTIETHRTTINRKLRTGSAAGAVAWAFRHGILT